MNIFLYDNAPHFPELTTFPHHKHLADGRVSDAKIPTIEMVLNEIAGSISKQRI